MLYAILFSAIFLLTHPTTAQLPTSKATSPLTQHILHPTTGDTIAPGTTFTIQWIANPAFKTVTLQLWDKTSWGFARDLLSPCHPWSRNPFCGTIASSAPNTGSFTWLVPNPQNGTHGAGFPRAPERAYWIKMYVEDYAQPAIGNEEPVLSYSSNFAFAREGEGGSLVSGVPSGTGWGDAGLPTVFVTVSGGGTAGVTGGYGGGEEGGAKETGTGTEEAGGSETGVWTGNGTALVPVEGGASKVGWGGLVGGVFFLLGLL